MLRDEFEGQIGRSHAPRGRTPPVARTAKRITLSMIAAVSNRGVMCFMLYEGALNADRLVTFLRQPCKDADRKVFFLVDNLEVHHVAKVKTWAAAHAHAIELFHLPACAPDHNPDACPSSELRQKLRRQPQPATRDEMIKTPARCRAPYGAHLAASRSASGRPQCGMQPDCRVYPWDMSKALR